MLEYFKETLGADKIVKDKTEYKQGKLLEEIIKYQRKGVTKKVRIVDGKHTVVTENNIDLLPGWSGIFIFWAFHKAGIHPPKWELDKPNFSIRSSYKKGEYLPRPGDIVIKSGDNHYAMVVKTIPEIITDTKDLRNVKVVTINGNTAGGNHKGGQIQEKTDPYSYWDFYIKPIFKGGELTKKSDKEAAVAQAKSPSGRDKNTKTDVTLQPSDSAPNQYSTPVSPVGTLDIPKTEKQKLDAPESVADSKLNPKENNGQGC